MCFRPPDVQLKPLKCPGCGKRINNPNFRPDKCPFCGTFLPPELDGMDKILSAEQLASYGVSPAPAAPSTPAAPTATATPPSTPATAAADPSASGSTPSA